MLRPLTLLALCSIAAAQSTYSLTPITPPVPATSVSAGGIDEDGNVLLNLTILQYSTYQIWITGPGGTRQLAVLSPPLYPYDQPHATHLSDFGRALGQMDRRPTVWNPAGQPRFLRELQGHGPVITEVHAGNSAGWLVGSAHSAVPGGGGATQPVIWIGDQVVYLDEHWGSGAYCSDINEHGRIVGTTLYSVAPQTYRAMGWIRDGLNTPVLIGWAAGQWGNTLNALNNSGEAVGTAALDTNEYEGLRWKDFVMTPVPGTDELTKIARDGTAIGRIFSSGPYYDQPTVSIGSQAWNLQDLLDPQSGAGWDLVHAVDLNDTGLILCRAYDPLGALGVCVLTPTTGIASPGVPRRERTPEQLAQIAELLAQSRPRGFGGLEGQIPGTH